MVIEPLLCCYSVDTSKKVSLSHFQDKKKVPESARGYTGTVYISSAAKTTAPAPGV